MKLVRLPVRKRKTGHVLADTGDHLPGHSHEVLTVDAPTFHFVRDNEDGTWDVWVPEEKE